ncbi:hypothetical protein ACFL56_02905 [Candidatus Margulisiibacteriota bacterium]
MLNKIILSKTLRSSESVANSDEVLRSSAKVSRSRAKQEAEHKPKPKRGRGHKLTIEEMHQIAKSKGGKCLSKEYINTYTKLKWQCEKSHKFEMIPSYVKQGSWCPECRQTNRGLKKLTIEEMHQLAKEKEGKCISTKYINNITKLKWQCAEGHQFEMTPKYVKNGGWCPECIVNNKLEKMHQLAKKHGGKFLSDEYKGSLIKHNWQCKKGHTFEKKPSEIKLGRWCSICGNKRKGRQKKQCLKK